MAAWLPNQHVDFVAREMSTGAVNWLQQTWREYQEE
jgi:hypothetical protein